MRKTLQKFDVSARRRVAVAGTIALGISVLVGLGGNWATGPLVFWDSAAIIYMCWTWLIIWPMDEAMTARHASREDPSRANSDLLLLAASVASLAAVGFVLVRASSATGLAQGLLAGVGILSVILSWGLVHTIYTLRYALLYYSDPVGGVDFKESRQPAYADFAYLSLTLGMTFQVSDTDLSNRAFRKTALRHALLSYLFGTIIVATTINLIAGLGK
ncbi:MAG: DUF1345 domain-containing protein [Candidatus Saccharibacteria bacterium]